MLGISKSNIKKFGWEMGIATAAHLAVAGLFGFFGKKKTSVAGSFAGETDEDYTAEDLESSKDPIVQEFLSE